MHLDISHKPFIYLSMVNYYDELMTTISTQNTFIHGFHETLAFQEDINPFVAG